MEYIKQLQKKRKHLHKRLNMSKLRTTKTERMFEIQQITELIEDIRSGKIKVK